MNNKVDYKDDFMLESLWRETNTKSHLVAVAFWERNVLKYRETLRELERGLTDGRTRGLGNQRSQ